MNRLRDSTRAKAMTRAKVRGAAMTRAKVEAGTKASMNHDIDDKTDFDGKNTITQCCCFDW